MALSNLDIDDIMKKIKLGSNYLGTFSKNDCPEIIENSCVILNIQNSIDANGKNLPGTHWVSIGKSNKKYWYFDSFGLGPLSLNKVHGKIAYNTRQIQDNSSKFCGYYAIGACLATSCYDAINSLENFINSMNEPELIDNDKLIKKFIGKFKK